MAIMMIEKFDRSMKIIKLPLNSMKPILRRVGIVRFSACGMSFVKLLSILSTQFFFAHVFTLTELIRN